MIGTCGFVTKLKHVVALRPKGDKMEEAWRIEKSVPHIPTPLLLGKNLFLWNDQGIVTCVEPNTGKIHWSERAVRSGRFFGSPIAAGGNIPLMIYQEMAGQNFLNPSIQDKSIMKRYPENIFHHPQYD